MRGPGSWRFYPVDRWRTKPNSSRQTGKGKGHSDHIDSKVENSEILNGNINLRYKTFLNTTSAWIEDVRINYLTVRLDWRRYG